MGFATGSATSRAATASAVCAPPHLRGRIRSRGGQRCQVPRERERSAQRTTKQVRTDTLAVLVRRERPTVGTEALDWGGVVRGGALCGRERESTGGENTQTIGRFQAVV